ncbi:MAG TPA: mycofactocin system FadH/OYE family oxidoreductase 1 [Acidimicrobiales bacterium]|jgi:2,4-dienoyl-CoA reductase (NADPH2)|nr:mycofactocin system FadH/OYE family oxidoreductase 1 [Acidimicrobiales bacterium]
MPRLVDAVDLAGRRAPARVVFGPHETNLGRGRDISDRHVAYYERRAAGGAGVIVTETASVHPSDWPYERAPLATSCGRGWAAVADACHAHGALVLAGLGHAGGQGSSAYSQSVLWAPSPVGDAVSREMPAEMGEVEIAAVVAGFAQAARIAADSGLDGVEVDIGPLSLLRQFHSGLTNMRTDTFGTDRLHLTRQVLSAVRRSIGSASVLSVRLCCDELAPWAGVTPDQAAEHVAELAGTADLLVVVRGGPFSASAYRPDAHTAPGFNLDLCGRMRQAAAGRVPVVLQGSVVDPVAAQAALDAGTADLVEMTRAQIADPRLVELVRAGRSERVRPCILCNQACHVRDNRNPIISCVGEPRSGHETDEPSIEGTDAPARDVLVVGGGPAGLECARVLAERGHRVELAERTPAVGGALRAAAVGPGRERLALLPAWLESECRRLSVTIALDAEVTPADMDRAAVEGRDVILATGAQAASLDIPVDGSVAVVDAATLLSGGLDLVPPGPVVVHDPIGGPIGVGMAEWLAGSGREVSLVTPDQIAGTLLSLSGDLADANTRLARAGVHRELRARFREVVDGDALLEDVWTGEQRSIPCAVLVDCSHRVPDESLYLARPGTARAGDCVAPRSVLEAILEGRRRALELTSAPTGPAPLAMTGAS